MARRRRRIRDLIELREMVCHETDDVVNSERWLPTRHDLLSPLTRRTSALM